MTDKPDCSTCNGLQFSANSEMEWCAKTGETLDCFLKKWVENHGCSLHPSAREYLMKDVIEELEEYKNVSNGDETPYDAYTTAISLIKNGVIK